jgi:hypothetical protein
MRGCSALHSWQRSELGLDRYGQLVRPCAENLNRLRTEGALSEVLAKRPAFDRLGDLSVELEVFEAVGRDVVTTGSEDQPGYPRPVAGDEAHRAGLVAGIHDTVLEQVPSQLGHASASMTLDVYAGLFGDDLDAVAKRLDEAVVARDADYLRTGTINGGVVDLGKRRSPGR